MPRVKSVKVCLPRVLAREIGKTLTCDKCPLECKARKLAKQLVVKE